MVVELLKKSGAGLKRKSSKKDPEDERSSENKAAGKKSTGRKAAGKAVAGKKAAAKKASARKNTNATTAASDAATAGKSAAILKKESKTAAKGGARRQAKAVDRGARMMDGDQYGSSPDSVEPEGDPFEVARTKVKGSVPAIVEAMVKAAKKGSCSHAKTVLEMTGARHMFDEAAKPKGSSEAWAKRVLKRMEEAEEQDRRKAPPEAVAKQ